MNTIDIPLAPLYSNGIIDPMPLSDARGKRARIGLQDILATFSFWLWNDSLATFSLQRIQVLVFSNEWYGNESSGERIECKIRGHSGDMRFATSFHSKGLNGKTKNMKTSLATKHLYRICYSYANARMWILLPIQETLRNDPLAVSSYSLSDVGNLTLLSFFDQWETFRSCVFERR
jgi:hypothetical protein